MASLQEIYYGPTTKPANRTGIETNINTYFSIYTWLPYTSPSPRA